tara:strand:- start:132 stop:425 length:294 start_codon:yes stop_codon:yes gene_type:complete
VKITKARLKEIIQEELQREMAMDPEGPDFSVSGAEDLKRSIAQDQEARGYDPDHLPRLKDELLGLYKQYYKIGGERASLELIEDIEALEAEIQDIEI